MSNPNDALTIARQRIAEEAERRSGILYLKGLELRELPEELAALTHLRHLYLGQEPDEASSMGSQITDLSLLVTLTGLRSLNCSGTLVTDLTPLTALIELQALDCSGSSIKDLTPLTVLTDLQTLDCSNTPITDLAPLAPLALLHRLDCSGTSITDFTPLAALTGLKTLLCFSTSIEDLTPLKALTALKKLDLVGTSITNLIPLAALTNLQILYCWKTSIKDLTPLSELTRLHTLNCSSTSIVDLSPLANLTDLYSLECADTLITNLNPLANLTNLNWLDFSRTSISDLQPLTALRSLKNLYCWRTSISDISPLAALTILEELDCSHTYVSNLTPLESTSLKHLDASSCQLTQTDMKFWQLHTLQEVTLLKTNLPGIPNEVLSRDSDENCLPRLRAHLADLQAGAETLTDVKLLVLGNGRAGKTQLVNRLRGPDFPYQPEWDSTHGVQVAAATLPDQGGPDIRVHLWDFGGQDIYHGTHALFTRTRAITAVVWASDTEREHSYERDGIRFRNHPLRYWVNYARHQGGACNPLLIVQGKCDTPAVDVRRPPVEDADLTGLNAWELRYSALNDRGRAALDEKLREAAALVHGAQPPLIGAGRLRVQRCLEALRDADAGRAPDQRQHRTLDQAEFKRYCAEAGGVSDPALLLDYLHHCGVLFYRAGLFNDHIILDQGWALDAIYAVFQRQKSYRHLRFTGGRFTRPLLEDLVWSGYSLAEQQLFLSMMQQCGICFVHRCGLNQEQVDDDTEYLAPDLLPERSTVQTQIEEKWDTELAIEYADYHYEFSHPGLMRLLTARIGNEAKINALYWQGGVCLYEASTRSRALLEYRTGDNWQGMLSIKTQTGQAGELLGRLCKWVDAEQTRLGLTPSNTPKRLEPTTKHRAPLSVATGEAAALAEPALVFTQPPRAAPEMFVSYAWSGDDALIDSLCARAAARGLLIQRDSQAIGLGDSIRRFMERIGQGDRIFVILSQKYLQSSYCMFELFEVWKHSRQNPKHFLDRVRIYALPDTRIATPLERIRISVHWKQQHDALQAAIREHGAAVIGEADFRAFKLMGDFARHVSDILACMADIVRPTTLDQLVQYGLDDLC